MRKRDVIPLAVMVAVSAALWLCPSPRQLAVDHGRSARARVLAVDASGVEKLGLLDYGSEKLEVEVLNGPEKGRRFVANNEIRAQLDLDKNFGERHHVAAIAGFEIRENHFESNTSLQIGYDYFLISDLESH